MGMFDLLIPDLIDPLATTRSRFAQHFELLIDVFLFNCYWAGARSLF